MQRWPDDYDFLSLDFYKKFTSLMYSFIDEIKNGLGDDRVGDIWLPFAIRRSWCMRYHV